MRRRCAICGDPITTPFCFCSACEKEFWLTGPVGTWPEWARFLENDEQRERYRELRDAKAESREWECDFVPLSQAEDEALELGLDCVQAHYYIARRAGYQP